MGHISSIDIGGLQKRFKLKTYVELGLGVADCLQWALQFPFEGFYSVDLDHELVDRAEFLKNRATIVCDYSTNFLKEFLPKLDKDNPICLFYDSHFPFSDIKNLPYSESIEKYRNQALPLEEEVKITAELHNNPGNVYIIDDAHLVLTGKECHEIGIEHYRNGNGFPDREYAKSLGINLSKDFIYDTWDKTHLIEILPYSQGFFVITPK